MKRHNKSLVALAAAAAITVTPATAGIANAELSPKNVLNVVGIPLANANAILQTGVVQVEKDSNGDPIKTNLAEAVFALLTTKGATGDGAAVAEALQSYFDQASVNLKTLDKRTVGYDVAQLNALFGPAAPAPKTLAAPAALTAQAPAAANPLAAPDLGSILDIAGLPLQLATRALSTIKVDIRDGDGNVIFSKGANPKPTPTNVVNAIFKDVVELGSTGNWGVLAENIKAYLAQFAGNVASGGYQESKPVATPAPTPKVAAVNAVVTTQKEADPVSVGLVGDLFTVAGIPLNNATQALGAFVVPVRKADGSIALDANKDPVMTNVVNAIFKAVVDFGITGQWGALAKNVEKYIGEAITQVVELPGNILSYNVKAITNVIGGGTPLTTFSAAGDPASLTTFAAPVGAPLTNFSASTGDPAAVKPFGSTLNPAPSAGAYGRSVSGADDSTDSPVQNIAPTQNFQPPAPAPAPAPGNSNGKGLLGGLGELLGGGHGKGGSKGKADTAPTAGGGTTGNVAPPASPAESAVPAAASDSSSTTESHEVSGSGRDEK